jgi:IS5 family transposase
MLQFEDGNWANDPELGLMDTMLEQNPKLIKMLENDITAGKADSAFGRKDTPSVEQIVRAAIYMEMKTLTIAGWNTHRKIRGYANNL